MSYAKLFFMKKFKYQNGFLWNIPWLKNAYASIFFSLFLFIDLAREYRFSETILFKIHIDLLGCVLIGREIKF